MTKPLKRWCRCDGLARLGGAEEGGHLSLLAWRQSGAAVIMCHVLSGSQWRCMGSEFRRLQIQHDVSVGLVHFEAGGARGEDLFQVISSLFTLLFLSGCLGQVFPIE